MNQLLGATRRRVASAIEQFPKSLLCWSGGKDSMVLLHLLRQAGARPEVVFFREPWQPQKYEFQERIIREWGLFVHTWHPERSAMQQKGDDFEVQNVYVVNRTRLTCPTGIVPPVEDLPWTCALDILRRPKQSGLTMSHFDALWIGHKRCDSDPVLGGDAGTRIEARVMPQEASLLFPLRDWTHEDIWNYTEEYGVPYDAERYEKVNGQWREKPERRRNADYVHACTRCLDSRPSASKFVECPKLEMLIENVADKVPWVEPEKLSYMSD